MIRKATPMVFRGLASLLVIGAAASAQAGAIQYVTPDGSKTKDGDVKAEAFFTLGNGSLQLTLTNLFANLTSDGQQISAITFKVGGATGSGALTTTGSGLISTISKGGAYTAGKADSLERWDATQAGTSISLTTLTGGKPNRLIIGPDDKGGFDPSLGKYSKANSSIIQHTPSALGTAIFDILISGITESSVLSDVVFQFGTDAGQRLVTGELVPPPEPTPSPVPEPSTFALLGLGGLGIAARACRRRKAAPTTDLNC